MKRKEYDTKLSVDIEEKHFEFLEKSMIVKRTDRYGQKLLVTYHMLWKNSFDQHYGITPLLDKDGNYLPYDRAIKKFLKVVHSSNKLTFK